MTKSPITWFAVIDGAHARLLQSTDNRHFHLVGEMSSADAQTRTHDLVSDRQGRGHESAASAHHAIGERHDAHDLAKQAFLHTVADRLHKAAQEASYDRLVLVAPKRQLGQLRACLPTVVRDKIAAELAKDLVKLPTAELDERLLTALQRR